MKLAFPQSTIRSLKQQSQKALNWVMPAQCFVCSKNLETNLSPVCSECYPNLPFEDCACQLCGQPFAAQLDYCGRCITSPPPYDRCFCAFRYDTTIGQQIRKLKYSERPELAMQIAKLLKREIDNHQLERPDLLIPVPIHISKLRQRGFNHSLQLTKCLSAMMNIPYKYNTVVKHRVTPPQAQQTLSFRKTNLKGCFRLNHKVQAKKIRAQHVAIIDDVVTTGSTVAEITKILKRNGVDYVQVWGVAHTT